MVDLVLLELPVDLVLLALHLLLAHLLVPLVLNLEGHQLLELPVLHSHQVLLLVLHPLVLLEHLGWHPENPELLSVPELLVLPRYPEHLRYLVVPENLVVQ